MKYPILPRIIIVLIITLISFLYFHKPAFADWPIVGNVTQINNNTVQIDNIGSGWSGCSGYWYSQVYGSNDSYTYPLAGGTLGNGLNGASCQTISTSSIQITFEWPYNFYFYPQTYKIFYANNNNYDTTYMTNYFTISSATPPQDNHSYSILYSDSFTNLNGVTLTTHNSNWTLRSGPESYIQNNQLITPAQSEFYLNNFASTVGQCLSFDVQFPLNDGIYFRTRYNPNTQDGFLSYLSADNNSFGIYVVTGGNASYINSGYYQLPTSDIHNIKQCSIGSNTVIYLDNLSIASGISSNNQMGTAGFYGPGFSTQPNIIDNVLYQSVNLNNSSSQGNKNLNVFPLLQTSNPWQSEVYDGANFWSPSKKTIKYWGCAITSYAMILNYFGINKLPNGMILDPGTLNIWLKNNNGYIDGKSSGFVNPVAISILSKKAKQINNITKFEALEYSRISNNNTQALTESIQNNIPAILDVGGHFVVVKGISENTFNINDPYYETYTNLATSYPNGFKYAGKLTPSNTDISYILITGDQNLHFNLKDSTGNEIGEEYLQEPLINDETNESSEKPIKILLAPKPSSGKYTLNITGNNGKKDFQIYMYDQEGNLKFMKQTINLKNNKLQNINIYLDKNHIRNSSINRGKEENEFEDEIKDWFNDLFK